MSSSKSQQHSHADAAPPPVSAGWPALRARLERERAQVYARIRAYPTPITGCDDQFNDLLEQRDRLGAELSRLDAARAACAPEREAESIAAFVAASPCLDGDSAAT